MNKGLREQINEYITHSYKGWTKEDLEKIIKETYYKLDEEKKVDNKKYPRKKLNL